MSRSKCETCAFLMPDNQGNLVCAGRQDIYGVLYEDVPVKYKEDCDEYEMCLTEYLERVSKNDEPFFQKWKFDENKPDEFLITRNEKLVFKSKQKKIKVLPIDEDKQSLKCKGKLVVNPYYLAELEKSKEDFDVRFIAEKTEEYVFFTLRDEYLFESVVEKIDVLSDETSDFLGVEAYDVEVILTSSYDYNIPEEGEEKGLTEMSLRMADLDLLSNLISRPFILVVESKIKE